MRLRVEHVEPVLREPDRDRFSLSWDGVTIGIEPNRQKLARCIFQEHRHVVAGLFGVSDRQVELGTLCFGRAITQQEMFWEV